MTTATKTERAYPHLKGTDRVIFECGKCEGTGSVSWGLPITGHVIREDQLIIVNNVCFNCHGEGKYSVLVSSIRARQRREERKAQEAAERAALIRSEYAAKKEAFDRDHADVLEFLPTLTGDFGLSMRLHLAENGTLTENQVAAVRKIAAERSLAAEVVEGRIEITGEILSAKFIENGYNGNWKIRVKDDRGFTVWGTLPKALHTEFLKDSSSANPWANRVAGTRVQFTATVEASDNDNTFGFFSRPAKGHVLES